MTTETMSYLNRRNSEYSTGSNEIRGLRNNQLQSTENLRSAMQMTDDPETNMGGTL